MEAGTDLISSAQFASSQTMYRNAFNCYLLAFDKNPRLRRPFEPEFRNTLAKFNEHLLTLGSIEEILENFNVALTLFPESERLVNDAGKYLYLFNFYKEACNYFQKALRIDPGFVNAEKNLNSVKNLLLERWHYRMLNDKIRNESYRAAIAKTLIPFKDTIIDIGAGTGLLSLYCLQHQPKKLCACDASEQMVEIAERIFADNGHHNVDVIQDMSTNLLYKDIGERRSLVVTELFDAGLFGEHILKVLLHAHEQLLSNDGRVLPNKAEFFVIGANCDHLNKKYQLGSEAKELLNISELHVHIITDYHHEESYDCEDVYKFKGLNYMTESQSVVKVDFNDYNDLKEKFNSTNKESYKVQLKATENGKINVIIGWFNLYLTDDISLTTDPRSDERASAWQQAVFFDYVPHNCARDQVFDVEFLLLDEKLIMLSNSTHEVLKVPVEVVKFLNDTEYVEMIKKCLGMVSVYLGQIVEMSEVKIADFLPFPLFGLLMLKRGVKSVKCWAKTSEQVVFLKKVLEANEIPFSKIDLFTDPDWNVDAFEDEKYHIIFCNFFDVCGDVELDKHRFCNDLKNAHLLPGGLFMPASMSLVAQVVESHWLDINNRVYDTNTSNYGIGKYINKYQVSQNFCLDFSCLEYTALTEPVVLGNYGNVTSGVVDVPIIKTGDASAILCWYQVELMDNMGEISTNRGDSFISGTVFLANPPVGMVYGNVAHVLRCIDSDGHFKLMIDTAT